MQILSWRAVPAGSMVGVADIQLASGMILHEIVIMRGKLGSFWASPPAKPMIGGDGHVMLDAAGRRRYVAIVDFVDAQTRLWFSNAVIQALRAAYPDALADRPPEPPPPPPTEMAHADDDEIAF